MKILDSMWFNGCGIVRVETEYDGIKYYIRGMNDFISEEEDAKMIAEWGSAFPNPAGDILFGV